MDLGAVTQSALLLARRVERRDPHPGRGSQRPSDAQAWRQPPRVLRHDRSSGPDAAAGRALSVCRMAARPRGAGLPRRSSGALLLGPIPHDPPGHRGAGHRGDHRGVPSRHPHREPHPLGVKHRYTTIPEHMPSAHRRYAFWTPARLLAAAEKIGPSTVALCEAIMRTKPHPEQGFRSCLGILRMEKTYGARRIEAACSRGISIGSASYRSIASILKTGLDKAFLPDTTPDADPIQHGNIRGRGYYH